MVLCLNRKDSLPVSAIWQWWVSRSKSAVVILASPNTADHSEKLKLVVITTLVCSVQLGQEVKQQSAPGLAEGQIPQLVKDHQIQAHQRQGDASGLAFPLFALQLIDQINRRVKAHPFAFCGNASHPNGCGQMRLAGARPANEHRVLRRVGELQRRQLPHQLLIDLCPLKVKARQVTVQGKLGCTPYGRARLWR